MEGTQSSSMLHISHPFFREISALPIGRPGCLGELPQSTIYEGQMVEEKQACHQRLGGDS